MFFFYCALFFFLVVAFLLCAIILVQEGKGGGLGASFGGGDSGDSMFGTSTPEVLKKSTYWLAIVFVVSCIVLSFWTASLGRHGFKNQNQVEQVK